MTIPNADLVQAVLDGKLVQVSTDGDSWTDMEPGAAVVTLVRAASGLRFRLKPRTIVSWLPVVRDATEGAALGNVYVDRDRIPRELPAGPVLKLIRIELDPHTLEPVSVRSEPLPESG